MAMGTAHIFFSAEKGAESDGFEEGEDKEGVEDERGDEGRDEEGDEGEAGSGKTKSLINTPTSPIIMSRIPILAMTCPAGFFVIG